ncbi:MAG: protein translocase subunit SecF [Deltaproteobacteria bacterium]|nr:protein translocase subunit SecF [Deltaproteobacteria bacterium]
MQIIPANTNIPFMKIRWFAYLFSILMIATSVYKWVTMGDEKFGVDFRGGVEAVVSYENKLDIAALRAKAEEAGIKDAIVQVFHGVGDRFSIRYKAEANENAKGILESNLSFSDNKARVEKLDQVGPVIGEQIRTAAYWAIFWALVGIIAYLTIRFEFRFAIGAVIALFHDVIITAGACILTGREINAGILAALLTIVGYSVNDTIIIFDRIREHILEALKKSSRATFDLSKIMDLSVNETLSRTIITNMTVMAVCLILWRLGGGAVEDMAFALFVGGIVGTYSTIFIASPIVLALEHFGNGRLSRKVDK